MQRAVAPQLDPADLADPVQGVTLAPPSTPPLARWAIIAALVIACGVGASWWLDWRGSLDRYRDQVPGPVVTQAAWFLWSPSSEDNAVAVVALEPGGEPLAGAWIYRVGDHREESLRGTSVPTTAVAPGVSSPPTLQWGGRDRVLLLYVPPLLQRPWTRTLVRDDASTSDADPDAVRYHECAGLFGESISRTR